MTNQFAESLSDRDNMLALLKALYWKGQVDVGLHKTLDWDYLEEELETSPSVDHIIDVSLEQATQDEL